MEAASVGDVSLAKYLEKKVGERYFIFKKKTETKESKN